jgi:hypothetical protein
MKRSFLAIALLACASLAAACYHAVADPIVAVCRMTKSFLLDACALAANEGSGVAKPAVQRVQAKAFVQRIEKRERPVLTSSWRMCPST